jgi:hypothetical protein
MNTTFKILFGLLLCSLMAFGQTTMTSTTLSAAVTATQDFVLVASATGITAPGNLTGSGPGNPSGSGVIFLYMDREAMRVNGLSGTRIFVERGYAGTTAAAHVSGSKVWVGPAGRFAMQDPAGGCTLATIAYLPRVVIPTGALWTCGASQWTTFGSFNERLTEGATLDVSTSGTTITPTNPVHPVSGTSSGFHTITVPAACQATGCQIYLIPTAQWTSTASGGNIGLATTAVVGKVVVMTYLPSTSKWYPSY